MEGDTIMRRFFSVVCLMMMTGGAVNALPDMVPTTGRGRQASLNQSKPSPRTVENMAARKASMRFDNDMRDDTTLPVNIVPSQFVGQPKPTPDVPPQPEPEPTPDVPPQPEPEPTPDVPPQPTPEKSMEEIEAEKRACINSNVGIGNSFVWAAKDSDVSNYMSMMEDYENPANNTCFVLVEMRSDNPRVSVDDIYGKYFQWGQEVECGSWADYETMKSRILDASKKKRVGAAIATTLGGMGLGVGISEAAMTIAANNRGDSKVQGQLALSGEEFVIAKIKEMQKENTSRYGDFVKKLKDLKSYCTSKIDNEAYQTVCNEYDYLFEKFADGSYKSE